MMIEISIIRDLVAIFGVIAGFSYYVLAVRATRKNQELTLETRQAQLFMQLYNRWSDPEFGKYYGAARYRYTEHIFEILKKSVDPYDPDVHAPYHALGQFFEGMGARSLRRT
jgi:hypothetical protein